MSAISQAPGQGSAQDQSIPPTGGPPLAPRKRRFPWADVAFWVVALLFIVILLTPLYMLFKVSVSTLSEATAPRGRLT